jgi:hypothetical protein
MSVNYTSADWKEKSAVAVGSVLVAVVCTGLFVFMPIQRRMASHGSHRSVTPRLERGSALPPPQHQTHLTPS